MKCVNKDSNIIYKLYYNDIFYSFIVHTPPTIFFSLNKKINNKNKLLSKFNKI